ncbi:hypothetical protein E4185_19215 [Aeromonas media]|uniref:hypothetical protein n=1 Tax=Aeromonas media TaxID=651 RepID=UPI00148AF852|nr:hypothetical protein [Aeromonas media]QJT27961.1 hypothetical protein E4185_19215 [Aeromonas media]
MKNITLQVLVTKNGHCNLDSFPLRFGFKYDEDTTIEISNAFAINIDNKSERIKYEGSIKCPATGRRVRGYFIVQESKEGFPSKLVTAWRFNDSVEFYLSEVLKSLRKAGVISSEWLLRNHALYISGKLRTHKELVEILSKEMSFSEIEKIRTETEKTISSYEKKLEEFNVIRQRAVDEAAREKDRADKLSEKIDILNNKLNALINSEMKDAYESGNNLHVTNTSRLVRVNEGVLYNGSYCTSIVLDTGEHWYMKTSIFDRLGRITEKAKTLIGREVKVTSWDPIREPGKWSSKFYFRNIYAID